MNYEVLNVVHEDPFKLLASTPISISKSSILQLSKILFW